MTGLTPFGKAIRKLRVEKDMRLLDLAKLMSLSTAFLSAVETGRKPIPDGFVVAVSKAMNLSSGEVRALRTAVDRTRKEVRVENLSEDHREFVAAFARRLDDVPNELLDQLRKHVLKSIEGEVPFRRKRRGFLVPPISTKALREYAEKIRSIFITPDRIEFPILDVLEFKMGKIFPDYFLDVYPKEKMGDDEGRVYSGRDELVLREDVYESLCKGDRRARFTACHELFHYLAHRTIPLSRARDDTDNIYCDSEWQADTFAGTLLMSTSHVHLFRDFSHAADLCKITPAAATVMWAKYSKEGLIKPHSLQL